MPGLPVIALDEVEGGGVRCPPRVARPPSTSHGSSINSVPFHTTMPACRRRASSVPARVDASRSPAWPPSPCGRRSRCSPCRRPRACPTVTCPHERHRAASRNSQWLIGASVRSARERARPSRCSRQGCTGTEAPCSPGWPSQARSSKPNAATNCPSQRIADPAYPAAAGRPATTIALGDKRRRAGRTIDCCFCLEGAAELVGGAAAGERDCRHGLDAAARFARAPSDIDSTFGTGVASRHSSSRRPQNETPILTTTTRSQARDANSPG